MFDQCKALRYQQALASFTRIVSETDSIASLLQNAVAQISRITEISHVKVLRYRAERGDLLIEAGVGWRAGVVRHASFSADRHSPPGRSLQTGQAVVIDDIRNNRDLRHTELLREHGIVSVCNVPILVHGKHWGVLEVDTEERTSFHEFEIHSLSIFANIIGLSLAHRFADADTVREAAQRVAAKVQSETLLRELQHRMKNNLQTIVSFLSLQMRETENEETRQRIAASVDRVLAISLAHDQLTFREGASSVEMKDYLTALCANIDPRRPNISMHIDVDPVSMPLDRAVPVGMVANELVTNAFKYAFGDEEGTISVEFRVAKNIGEAQLTVDDNGRGMGTARTGFGSKLVESLAAQLGGRLTHKGIGKGTRVELRLPYSV